MISVIWAREQLQCDFGSDLPVVTSDEQDLFRSCDVPELSELVILT
jgi:hypothetical protein